MCLEVLCCWIWIFRSQFVGKAQKPQAIVPFSESYKIEMFLDFFSRLGPYNKNQTSGHTIKYKVHFFIIMMGIMGV